MSFHLGLWPLAPAVALSLALTSCSGSAPKSIQVDKQQQANGGTSGGVDHSTYPSSDADNSGGSYSSDFGNHSGTTGLGSGTLANAAGTATTPVLPSSTPTPGVNGSGSPAPAQIPTLAASQAQQLLGSWTGKADSIPTTVQWVIKMFSGVGAMNASGSPANGSGTANDGGTTANAQGTTVNQLHQLEETLPLPISE